MRRSSRCEGRREVRTKGVAAQGQECSRERQGWKSKTSSSPVATYAYSNSAGPLGGCAESQELGTFLEGHFQEAGHVTGGHDEICQSRKSPNQTP